MLSHSKIALASIGVLVIIMLFSAFQIQPGLGLDNSSLVIREGNLTKVTNLRIAPGETYSYSYKVGNESTNLTYSLSAGFGCTAISMLESQARICINEYGNDRSGLNSTYSEPVIITKPWMLAVRENWRWNVSSVLVFQGFEKPVEDVSFSTVRKEYYRGREAYVVKLSSSLGSEIWDWVDADKRVVLREIGPGYELVLVDGLQME